jgi:DNA-binding MarR family transcriptional regulator
MDRNSKPAAEPHRADSLEQMAEEIFTLTVMSWRERLSARHDGAELSESQYLALEVLVLAGENSVTVGEIQRSIGVVPAQMSRIISSLQTSFDRPLIRCELNQSDRRKIDVFLTPEGQGAYDGFRKGRLKKAMDLLKELPEHDRKEFVRICAKMRELYRAAEQSRSADA